MAGHESLPTIRKVRDLDAAKRKEERERGTGRGGSFQVGHFTSYNVFTSAREKARERERNPFSYEKRKRERDCGNCLALYSRGPDAEFFFFLSLSLYLLPAKKLLDFRSRRFSGP